MSDTLTHVRTPERHRLTIGHTIAIWATVLVTAIAVGAVMRPLDAPTPLAVTTTTTEAGERLGVDPKTIQRDGHESHLQDLSTTLGPDWNEGGAAALPAQPRASTTLTTTLTTTLEPTPAVAAHPAVAADPPAAPTTTTTTTTTLPEAIAPPPTMLEPTTTIEEPINARVNTPVPTIP